MQEVIVYRNPAEAAMWNLLSNAEFFPVIVGVIAFFIVFLASHCLLTQGRSFNQPAWKTYAPMGLGVLAAVGVINWML